MKFSSSSSSSILCRSLNFHLLFPLVCSKITRKKQSFSRSYIGTHLIDRRISPMSFHGWSQFPLIVKEDGDLVWRDSNFLAKNWLENLELHQQKHNNISNVDFSFPSKKATKIENPTLVSILFPACQWQSWRMLLFAAMLEASISFSMDSDPLAWCARSVLKKYIPSFFPSYNHGDLLQYVDFQDPSHACWPLTIITW